MAKFKVGDKVRRISGFHAGMKVGDIGTVVSEVSYSVGLKEFGSSFDYFHDKTKLELVQEPTSQGPVRTKNVKEIVPGEYGIVRILEIPKTPFPMHVNLRIDHGLSSATELRAAAATLLEIAGALE